MVGVVPFSESRSIVLHGVITHMLQVFHEQGWSLLPSLDTLLLYALGSTLGVSVATCVIFAVKTVFHWREKRSYRRRYWALKDSLRKENTRLVNDQFFTNIMGRHLGKMAPELMRAYRRNLLPSNLADAFPRSESSNRLLTGLDTIYSDSISDNHSSSDRRSANEKGFGDFRFGDYPTLPMEELENFLEFYLHQREILKITDDILCVTNEIQSQAAQHMMSRSRINST